ncbi:hypothetical protein ACFYOG_34370 [Streptomyces sp. NPDC007818]|uniref:hypothetical protein n=1 Tax=Streptomyces sp. NPDC007818 TaxID=3364780 RepID=UPI0036B050EB
MFKTIKARRGIVGTAAALSLLGAGAVAGVAIADDAAVKAKAPYAMASAQINADGTRAQSKGIKSSTRIDTGIYCVKFDDATKIDVSRSTPVATIVTTGGPQYAINLRTSPSPECGNAADTLTVYTGERNLMVDTPFMLLVP